MKRLQRKKLKHRLRVCEEQKTLKELLSKPEIKNTDVEAIKREFETLAANRPQQKKVEPIEKVESSKEKSIAKSEESTTKSKKENNTKSIVDETKTKKEAEKTSIRKNKKVEIKESVDQKSKTETSQVEKKTLAKKTTKK